MGLGAIVDAFFFGNPWKVAYIEEELLFKVAALNKCIVRGFMSERDWLDEMIL